MVAGLKVTPLVLDDSAIEELKPPEIVVVMVTFAEPPRAITSLRGAALMVNDPLPPPLVNESIRAAPIGLPQPVARS